MSNKAVVLDRAPPGQKPELTVRDVEKPTIGEQDVLVKMLLMPVNPSDVASVSLIYPGFNRTKTFPATPGLEGVGVIEKVGSNVTQYKAGQRLVAENWGAVSGNGTWQTYKAIPASSVIPVPDKVSDEAAAQFLVNPCTALGFLDSLQIPEGKWLIQSGASSELGRMMIHLCKHKGIKTINIVRRSDAKQELLDEGADVVISSSEDTEFAAKVKEATGGEMAYGAIDPVSGDMTGKLAACVRSGGTVLVYGALGGITIDGLQLRDLLFRGVHVTGFWLQRYFPAMEKAKLAKFYKEVMDLIAQGVIRPRAGDKFPLDKVKEALAASQQSGRNGKVLLQA